MYIQVHLKKIEYRGKVNFFPSYILESLHIKCHVSSLFFVLILITAYSS